MLLESVRSEARDFNTNTDTGKPPPGSRNQYLPGLPVSWFAGWLVGGFADLLVCGFEGCCYAIGWATG